MVIQPVLEASASNILPDQPDDLTPNTPPVTASGRPKRNRRPPLHVMISDESDDDEKYKHQGARYKKKRVVKKEEEESERYAHEDKGDDAEKFEMINIHANTVGATPVVKVIIK